MLFPVARMRRLSRSYQGMMPRRLDVLRVPRVLQSVRTLCCVVVSVLIFDVGAVVATEAAAVSKASNTSPCKLSVYCLQCSAR